MMQVTSQICYFIWTFVVEQKETENMSMWRVLEGEIWSPIQMEWGPNFANFLPLPSGREGRWDGQYVNHDLLRYYLAAEDTYFRLFLCERSKCIFRWYRCAR